MKKQLITLLFLFPLYSLGQTKLIESFLGIKFGSSKEAASAIMVKKGALLDRADSKADLKYYNDVTVGAKRAERVALKFVNNKFFEGMAAFVPSRDPLVFDLFNSLKDDIDRIYGEGELIKLIKSPYTEGDDDEYMAIKSGHGSCSAFWKTRMPNGKDNYISLEISEDLVVKLRYQDAVLIQEAIKKQNEISSSDL